MTTSKISMSDATVSKKDSVQLQTVLALYHQETVRNNGQPSYSKLKTAVRIHTDQTTRTRNFRVRNEIVERGAVSKGQKGKNAYVGRKVRESYQWKANGQCSKRDSCRFSHDPALATDPMIIDEKDNRLVPHPIRRPRLTEIFHPQKVQVTEEKALQTRGRIPRRYRK